MVSGPATESWQELTGQGRPWPWVIGGGGAERGPIRGAHGELDFVSRFRKNVLVLRAARLWNGFPEGAARPLPPRVAKPRSARCRCVDEGLQPRSLGRDPSSSPPCGDLGIGGKPISSINYYLHLAGSDCPHLLLQQPHILRAGPLSFPKCG